MPPGSSFSDSSTPSPSAADFTRLFNLSLDLLCIAGLDGYFKRVNPSWTRVLGWSEAELLSRPVADFMHPEDRERTLQARAGLARGVPVRGLENRYRCKDGSYRWLAWQSITEPGQPTVFAVARDITERRQLDHEQLIMSKLESTGLLAGGIAHDFNNLLTGLTLSLELIATSGPVNRDQEHYLRTAWESINATKTLTDQLIVFANGGAPQRRLLDLKILLQQSLELALSGSGLHIESRIASDLWPVEADEAQLTQVMRNLVLNAREASVHGATIRLHAKNVAAAALPGVEGPPGDWVCVSVADEGIGIAPEVLPNVFDPYFSTKQRGAKKGMGLGLTICRTVVRKHGGAIALESRPNAGTQVTFHLPARGPGA